MTEGTQPNGDSSDSIESLVRGLVQAMSDPGSRAIPMASTDAEEVIRSQLTENTGRHLLDSGGAYGRHWEENQETPPWERPEWNVARDYVTHNVYHYMERRLSRSRTCVGLEIALYAYSYDGPGEGDSWLTCMEDFSTRAVRGEPHPSELTGMGVPEDAAGMAADAVASAKPNTRKDPPSVFTHNTYNGEWHGLSQVLQGTNIGGPHAKYVLLQVHGGRDVRGGYTAPRVYEVRDSWVPHELGYYCSTCGWSVPESVLGYDDDRLLYQKTVDPGELREALADRAPDYVTDDDLDRQVNEVVEEAYDRNQSGAVFHVEDGCGGVVRF